MSANSLNQETRKQFSYETLLAGVVSSLAALLCVLLKLEVWIMFIGYIGWFTRPTSHKEGFFTMLCMTLGILLGANAYIGIGALVPYVGLLGLPLIVFLVAIVVVGLRETRVVNNMLGWFLGLVTFFAAHMEISLLTLSHLILASSIGSLAGLSYQIIKKRFVDSLKN